MIIYGDYEDKQFMLILDKEVYNELTQFGRKKVLDTIDQIFIDYYVNCEVMSSFKVRFKEKVKELWFIFYYAIIKYKKINKLLDVERAQKMGIKYGLEFIKEIDEISERELGIKP